MSSHLHALVFGASGISGWALVKEALTYPTPTTFNQVTALTNRPLFASDAHWPNDSRLRLASGIDLTGTVNMVVEALKQKVQNIDTVTHVFLLAYIDPGKDKMTLKEVNTNLVRTAVEAMQRSSPQIKSFILQTGGKAYGLGMLSPPEKDPSQVYLPNRFIDRSSRTSRCGRDHYTSQRILPSGAEADSRRYLLLFTI